MCIFNNNSALTPIDTTQDNQDASVNTSLQISSNSQNKIKLILICWNIRGIYHKVFGPDMQKFLFTNDIIMLTESHTDKSSEKYYNTIPGFIYKDFPRKFIHPHAPGPSGGIAIYIKSDIIDGIELESTDESIVWMKLKCSFFGWESDKLIACAYFSPAESSYIHSTNSRVDYFNILSEQTRKFTNYNDIFICGDLNSRTSDLPDYRVNTPGTEGDLNYIVENVNNIGCVNDVQICLSRDKVTNVYGRELLDFCKNTGYRLMNGRLYDVNNTGDFTCFKENGASIVDYLICKPHNIQDISHFTILPKRVVSDHRPLSFDLMYPKRQTYQNIVLSGDEHSIKSYKWDINKLDSYKEILNSEDSIGKLSQLQTDIIDPNLNTDEICDKFYDVMNSAIRSTFEQKTSVLKSRFPVNKWFNEECKNAKYAVNSYSKMHDISQPPHSGIYLRLQKEYNRVKQKFERQYRDMTRLKLQNFHSERPDAYWKLWKSLNPPQLNNSKLTLKEFENYCKEQVNPPATNYFDNIHMDEIKQFVDSFNSAPQEKLSEKNCIITDDICNSPITMDEILTHLHKLKNHKAAGADGLSGEFLKYIPDEIALTLHTLFNSILDRGEWPTKWAEGLITPVHKKASINNTDNYRKITVMPVIGKVLESIMNARLVFRNITLNTDDPFQFGFKENARTSDNLFILQSIVNRQTFKNKPLYVCFVDFTKAFDYVNRYALYYKLIKRGVKGKLLNLICDMYKKAKCRVKWKGKVGSEIDSEYGVLQGGMLSPKLFTEFLTDLKTYLEKECGLLIDDDILMYILYADDLILCSESAEGLQKLFS